MIKAFFRVFKKKLHPNYNLFTFILSIIVGLLPILMFFEFLREDESEITKSLTASGIIFSFMIFIHLAIVIIVESYGPLFYAYYGLGVFGIILNFMNWFRVAIWKGFKEEVANEQKSFMDDD